MYNSIVGTNGPDTIIGTDQDDIIEGLAGDDTISAGKGNDIVSGGNGNEGNDTIDGGAGNDRLDGGVGDDTVHGGAGNDVLIDYVPYGQPNGNDIYDGGAGNDTVFLSQIFGGPDRLVLDLRLTSAQDTVYSGNDTFIGIENVVYGFANATIHGNASDNTLSVYGGQIALWGHEGDDRFVVGIGAGSNAVIDGGTGSDTFIFNSTSETEVYAPAGPTDYAGYTLSLARDGEAQGDTNGTITLTSVENIAGSLGNDTLTGNGEANLLAGNAGNDTLIGGGGNDRLYGDGRYAIASELNYGILRFVDTIPAKAGGNDVLEGGLGDDTLNGGFGNDTASYANAAGKVTASLVLGGSSGADGKDTFVSIENLTGSAYADDLTGNGSANRLDGGMGADRMEGGAGDDTYVVSEKGDVLVEQAGGGTDTVESTISYTLQDNLENITLTGSAAIDATGNAGANLLVGNSAVNVLTGLGGNDVYRVQNTDDVVVEAAGGGHDRVESSVSYTLGSNVEDLVLAPGLDPLGGTGNDLANLIVGNNGDNVIDGKGGADTLRGGEGNDTYFVHDAGDKVIETLYSLGYDTVYVAAETYRLKGSFEKVVMESGAISLQVDSYSEISVIGNAADNRISGGIGGTIEGGLGDDTYILTETFSIVVEKADEGTDTVIVAFPGMYNSYTLTANVENGILAVTDATLVGNDLANRLTGSAGADYIAGAGGDDRIIGGNGADALSGNAGNDWLDGGRDADMLYGGTGDDRLMGGAGKDSLNGEQGNDTLDGGADDDQLLGGDGDDRLSGGFGNDGLIGGSGRDVLTGGEGNDTLAGEAGRDTLNGGNGNDTLLGGSDNDTLNGGGGDDFLFGGTGRELLTGGAGKDAFVLDTSGTGRAAITDFVHGEDRILIATDSFTGALDPSAFHLGVKSGAETDRVIFDAATGRLWFDADGSGTLGAQLLIATLQKGTVLDAADIAFVSRADAESGLITL